MIDGIYMDGKTSKRVKARLEVFLDYGTGLCLHIDREAEIETIHVMIDDLNIS